MCRIEILWKLLLIRLVYQQVHPAGFNVNVPAFLWILLLMQFFAVIAGQIPGAQPKADLGLSNSLSSPVLMVCALCLVTCDSGLSVEFTEALHQVICPNSSLSKVLKTSLLSQDSAFLSATQKAGVFLLLMCFCNWACILGQVDRG